MMKDWRTVGLATVLGMMLLMPVTVLAHADEKRGSATAIFHLDPDDDPIVGQPTTIHALITHGDEPLALDACRCTITVMEGRTPIAQLPLAAEEDAASIWTGQVTTPFPERGAYTLVLTGDPTESDHFAPFTIRNVVRVNRTNAAQPAQPHDLGLFNHWTHYAVPAGAALYLGYALIEQSRRRRLFQRPT